MYKIVIFTLAISCFTFVHCGNNNGKGEGNTGAQTPPNENVKIAFREYEHNFGKVTEGEKVASVFTFENDGTEDLVITSAIASCGCTIPKYNKKPIPPGGAGSLEVVFNTSGRNGIQTKTITVKSNASVPVVLLKITAEVVNASN